jgi:hypothetical protein
MAAVGAAKRQPLGQVLLQLGFLDRDQLQAALGHQRQWGMPLGRAVLEKRFCTPEQLLQAFSQQLGLPLVDLDRERLDPFLAQLIPRKIAEQHRAVPLKVEGKRAENLVIAIAAPASLASLDAIQAVSGKSRVIPQLASDEAMARAIGRLYDGGDPGPLEPPRPVGPLSSEALHNDPALDLSGSAGAAPSATLAALDDLLGFRPPASAPAPAPADPWAGDGWADLDLAPETKAFIDQAARSRGEARKATVAAILEAYAAFRKR